MRSPLFPLSALVLGIVATPSQFLSAQAASRSLDLSVALRAGSPGFGLEVNKLITNHFGGRVGGNWLRWSGDKDQSDITYDLTVTAKAFTALLDFYPSARGSFHLTGGLYTNPVKVTAKGKPTSGGTFEINGNIYTAAQVGTLRGEAKYPDVGPYVGLGFGTPANTHHALKFLFDLGVVIGKAKVDLTATGAASLPQLANDLRAEIKDVQDDVDKYAFVFPVLSVGLAYRF